MEAAEARRADAVLVARCKRELPHVHTAFEKLVERHKNRVFTMCYRLVGNRSDAEDLVQEVFTKVFLNIARFEERSAFSSWLFRLAYNQCLNFISRRRREASGMAGYHNERKIQQDRADRTEPEVFLQLILSKMAEEKRTLLTMKYVMGLEISEISEIVGVAAGVLKMRLLRARKDFYRVYTEEETRRQ